MNRLFTIGLLCWFSPFVLLAQGTFVVATYDYPQAPREEAMKRVNEFVKDHVLADTKLKASPKVYPSVRHLLEGMESEEPDLVFINVEGYLNHLKGQVRYDITAVLDFPSGGPDYFSVLVARPGLENYQLANIKVQSRDLRLVYVSPSSSSGFMMMHNALGKAGMLPESEHFASVVFAGNHAAAAKMLIDGQADLAVFGHRELEKEIFAHLKSQVIWQSDPIPFGPVLIKKSLPEDLKSNIRRALYDMHTNAPSTFQAVLDAWIEASGAVRYKEGKETDYTFLLSDD